MAFKHRNVYTAIEIGSSKICALHGTCDNAGNPQVLGFGQRPSENSVVKASVVDYNIALKNLEAALDDADKSASEIPDRKNVFFLMSGATVSSRQGEGNTVIYDADRKIRQEHASEVIRKAQNFSLPPEQQLFNVFGSYFAIDGTHRVKNPVGQLGGTLDGFVHMISAERKSIDTVQTMLRELGYEKGGEAVFSGVASLFGALSLDERDHGTLLVDLGAGVCDYLVVQNDGILLSGVLPIGMDNVANDLAIALDLNIDICRKFLREGRLDTLLRTGESFLRIPGITQNRVRQIPVGSIEKIVDMRLRETFSVIKAQIDANHLEPLLGAGTVLCGGGAMLNAAQEVMHEVMGTHVRRVDSFRVSGAMTGLDNNPAAYTGLLGLLKYAVEQDVDNQTVGALNKMGNVLENLTCSVGRNIDTIRKAFKL